MFDVGVIAVISQAIITNAPAEAACAASGVTYPITGTEEFIIFVIILRIEVASPPGVSISIKTAVTLLSSAFSMLLIT